MCLCLWERDAISWHRMAAILTMVPFSVGAPVQQSDEAGGRLLCTFLSLLILPVLIFFNSILYPQPVSEPHPCTNIVLLATLQGWPMTWFLFS